MQLHTRIKTFFTRLEAERALVSEQLRIALWIWILGLPLLAIVHLLPLFTWILCDFPSMVLHEIGHSVAAWLGGLPAISFFFASFYFSPHPIALFSLTLICIESYLLYRLRGTKRLALGAILILCMLLHCLFLLSPDLSEPFAIAGGLGGEIILPVIIFIVISELSLLKRPQAFLALILSSVVYWNSLADWIMAALGKGPIPYPHDSSGAVGLFQDPFNKLAQNPLPEGDLDKLLRVYNWTESQVINTYLSLCIITLFLLFGYIVLQGKYFELYRRSLLKGRHKAK